MFFDPAQKLRHLRIPAFGLFFILTSLFAQLAHAGDDEDYYINLDVTYANKYVSEGVLLSREGVYGLFVAFDTASFPLYAHISTVRDFQDFSDSEIALAFSYDFDGSRFLAGALYTYESIKENVVQLSAELPGNPSPPQAADAILSTTSRSIGVEGGELFLSFRTIEFYNSSLFVSYHFDLESRGSLFSLGLDINYDILDILNISAGALARFSNGYIDVPGIKGFYNVDYYVALDVLFFGDSGLEVSATFVSPYRSASNFGVTREIIYQANFHFSF